MQLVGKKAFSESKRHENESGKTDKKKDGAGLRNPLSYYLVKVGI